MDNFAGMIKKMQDYATERGSYFLFVLNPTKISIYTQYLRDGYHFRNRRLTYLKGKLEELGVNFIDNTQLLLDASQNEQVYNVKYDAGHWNERGAFYGINAIYKKMIEDGINIELLKESDYTISTTHANSLPVSKFEISEDVPNYELKNESFINTRKYNTFVDISKDHNTWMELTNNTVNNDYNLMFFRRKLYGT